MTRSATGSPAVPVPTVVSVGGTGSDPDAGIQADLAVFAAWRCRGIAVVTAAITATEVYPLPARVVRAQLDSVLATAPTAVKVGMVGDTDTAGVVTARARAGLPNLVLDPVLVHEPGHRSGVVAAYRRLVPYATVVTANLDEAAALVGWPLITTADMSGAASKLAGLGARVVVVTGGDVPGDEVVDVVWVGNAVRQLRARRVPGPRVPGAGCAYSAAVAAQLALGVPPVEAVEHANRYASRDAGRGIAGAIDDLAHRLSGPASLPIR